MSELVNVHRSIKVLMEHEMNRRRSTARDTLLARLRHTERSVWQKLSNKRKEWRNILRQDTDWTRSCEGLEEDARAQIIGRLEMMQMR